jgi:hypothetical protein
MAGKACSFGREWRRRAAIVSLARRPLPNHSYRAEAEFPKGCRLKPLYFPLCGLGLVKTAALARVTLDLTRSTNAFHVGPETS